MLKAIDPKGGYQIAQEITTRDPYSVDWECHICNRELDYVKESVDGRIAHYRHKPNVKVKHSGASESIAHAKTKLKLYKYYKSMPYTDNVVLEHDLGDRIADITLTHEKHGKIAIEIQLSLQNADLFEERTIELNQNRYNVLWLVDLEKFGNPFLAYGNKPNRKSKIIEWLQSKYYSRYYCVDYDASQDFDTMPLPEIVPCRIDYWNQKPDLTTGDVGSAEPFVPDEQDPPKIARFYDKKWW